MSKYFRRVAYISRGLQSPDLGHCGTFAIACNCCSAGTPDRTKDPIPLAEGLRAGRRGNRGAQASAPYRYGASILCRFPPRPGRYIASSKSSPAPTPRAQLGKKLGPICRMAVTLVVDANRTLAQETISGQDVIRGTLKG